MAKKFKDWNLQIVTAQFLADTQFWSMEERGMYITLICVHHQNGFIPKEIMYQVCGGLENPKEVYPLMMKHFTKISNGNYSHPETEQEITRREEYSKAQSSNATKRWSSQKDATASATAYAKEMPRDTPEHSVPNSLSSIESIEGPYPQALNNNSQALDSNPDLENLYKEIFQ